MALWLQTCRPQAASDGSCYSRVDPGEHTGETEPCSQTQPVEQKPNGRRGFVCTEELGIVVVSGGALLAEINVHSKSAKGRE